MNRRLLLSLAILLLVGAGVIGYMYSKPTRGPVPGPTQKQPTVNLSILKPVPVASLPNKQKAVSFSFSLAPSRFSSSLPVYKTNKRDIVTTGRSLAGELGFSGEPQIIEGIHRVYLWRSGNNIFSAQDYPFGISLRTEVPSVGILPSIQVAQAAVLAFVQKHNIVDPSIQMIPTGSSLLSTSGVNIDETTNPALADRVAVSYQYTMGGYPIFSQAGGGVGISALIGPGGNIRSISADVLPLVSTQTNATLLSIDYATVALQNNKGVLVNIDRPTPSESSVANISFSAVSITGVELGYIVLDSINSVQPVYVFTGVAQNTNKDSRGALVTYFVPAIIP